MIRNGARLTAIGLVSATESAGWITEIRLADPGCKGAPPSGTVLERFFAKLEEYLGGRRRDFTVPWAIRERSEFAGKVLTSLTAVGYGQTVSYGELATAAGFPRAARAVGGALHNNPLLVLVPCHRVIASNGSIGGFGSGIECKRRLHAIEGIGPLPV